MTRQNDNLIFELMEQLNSEGSEGFKNILQVLLNAAMRLEREQVLGASEYERTETRRGYANGYKPKQVKTRLGRMSVDIPQVRGDVDFYPSAIEKGLRSERALKAAIAEMYIKGISTRKVTKVLEKMCGLQVTASQVSRVTKELDEEIGKWRTRPLEEYPYLVLDARYEKVRHGGSLLTSAVFIAMGVGVDGKRSIIGCSASLTEAELHWKEFLESLKERGLSGVRFVTSDAHTGLKAALESVFPGVSHQRCQCHLQRNASSYVPRMKWKTEVASDIRDVWNAPCREDAEIRLKKYVHKWRDRAPKLADWMEENLPEGLEVFALPSIHRRRMRTTNGLEVLNKEIKRRTRVARIFPNEQSLIRLISAILIEKSEEWETGRTYIEMSHENESNDSNNNKIYRKDVA
jgi:putative transposase